MADLSYLIDFDSNTTGIDKSKFAISKLGAAMAALGVGFGAKELADIADQYSNMAGRINIAVGETGNFEGAMQGVKDIALATNSSLDATTQLFTKINDSGKQLGLTQQQSLDLTETINKAMALGGGAAASNEAAIIQLTQSLQSSVLRGDEFNSIMEQAPGISKALAASLGVTTGELRTMAGEGKLTSQVVIQALQEQSAAIESDYEKLPLTIGKALQKIQTQWAILIGEFDQDNGASSKVAEWIGALGDSMGMLDTVIADIGSGVQWVSDKIGSIDTGTIIAMRQAFESAYDALKSMASAAGSVLEGVGTAIDLTLGMLIDFDSGLQDSESSTGGFTKAIQLLNVAIGFIGDGFTTVGIAAKLITGVFYDLAAVWYQLTSVFKSGDWKDEAIANMDAMKAKAKEMYAEASDAALEFKSKGIAAIEDLSKTEAQVNAETLAELKANFADKEQAYNDFVLNEQNYAAQRIALEQQISEARKSGDSARTAEYIKQLDIITAKEKESTESQLALEQSKLESAQEYAQQAVDANKGVIDSTTLLELATQNYIASVDEAGKVSVTAFGGIEGASNEAALSIKDIALNAAKGLGIDVNEALNKVSSGFERNAESVNRVADGYNQLKYEGVDAGNLIAASLDKLLDGAKSQAEIDKVRQMYVQFGQDGKLSARQVEAGIDAINGKLEKTPNGLDAVSQAFKALGIISQEEADKQAKAAIANYELVKQSGQASAAQLSEALEGINSKIKDSGDASLTTWYQNQQAALSYSLALEGVEQSTTKSTASVKENANARNTQAIATNQAAIATDIATQNESASLAVMLQMTAQIKGKIAALEQLGATTGQTDAAFAKFMDSVGTFDGQRFLGVQDFANTMQRVNDAVETQVSSFTQAKNRADEMTQALSGNAVTSRDLADAQQALRKATDASVQGLIRMDSQTLSGLQSAIDAARSRMQGLSDDAKRTAENLEATLAKLQGNEDKARDIEQTRKLTELEEKLTAAKARGNQEEANQLSRALDLQKQINREEDKKVRAEQLEQAQRAQEQQRKSSFDSAVALRKTIGDNTDAKDVVDALDARIEREREEAAKLAVEQFMQQLKDEAKRRT